MNALVDTRVAQTGSLDRELAWLKSRLRGEESYLPSGQGGSPLDDLARRLNLTVFARRLLLLAAAPDLDDEVATLIAERSPGQPWPSLALAASIFDVDDLAALAPSAPLRALDLIRLSGDAVLSQKGIYADERVVFALRGIDTLDAWLGTWLSPLVSHAGAGFVDGKLAHALARLLADDADPLAILTGGSTAERHAHVLAAASLTGAAALRMTVPDAAQADPDPTEFVRRWRREAALSPRILLLEGSEWPARWLRAVEQITTCVIAADTPPDLPGTRRQTILRLPASDLDSRRARWHAHLPSLPDAAIMRLAAEYRHAPERLHLASNEAAAAEACRALTQGTMAGLAELIDANVDWADLVLPDDQARQLRDLADHAATRVLVGEHWGFARRKGRGNGVAALFAGPPGTGKTLAARVLAKAIGHDLYRVDLSRLVSKYVGETEKNIARVFDAADCGGAVLLFDEADALFGKRTEAKDSHDRHANLETAYLLQRMESFNGVAILTTNLDQLLDAAFLRRLAFVVRFPFPGEAARCDIWRRAFPAQTPVAPDVDPEQLARMPLAGGHIANIAWSAACRAAHAGCEVSTTHIVAAARAECLKLERPWQESWLHGVPR